LVVRYCGGVGLGIQPIYDNRFPKGIHYVVMQQSPPVLSSIASRARPLGFETLNDGARASIRLSSTACLALVRRYGPCSLPLREDRDSSLTVSAVCHTLLDRSGPCPVNAPPQNGQGQQHADADEKPHHLAQPVPPPVGGGRLPPALAAKLAAIARWLPEFDDVAHCPSLPFDAAKSSRNRRPDFPCGSRAGRGEPGTARDPRHPRRRHP